MIQQGDTFSISAELVDAEHDRQIWGKQYQRKLTDVDTLQSEITHDITEHWKMNLSGAQKLRIAQRSTENSEAYQLYLQGRFDWNKRTSVGVNRAMEYFQRAIARDPNFAPAFAGLADCYWALTRNGGTVSPREAGANAFRAAQKALDLDPSLPEAHASMGLVLLIFQWDFQGSEREFQHALQLNPGNPHAHQWYGELLYATGHYEEAVRELRKAVDLEPFSTIFTMNLGAALMHAKHFRESEQQFRKALEMDPTFPVTGYGLSEQLLLQNRNEEALKAIERVSASMPESSYYRGEVAAVYARVGRAQEARKILADLTEEANTKYVSWLGIADIYIALGEKDHAFAALELAYQQGDSRPDRLRARGDLGFPWSSDPRFADLLKRIGLPPLNR
jgi:Tfp pilus assembly protein PilF